MATDPELLADAIILRSKEKFFRALYEAVKGDGSALALIMRTRPLTITQQRIVANSWRGGSNAGGATLGERSKRRFCGKRRTMLSG